MYIYIYIRIKLISGAWVPWQQQLEHENSCGSGSECHRTQCATMAAVSCYKERSVLI